MNKKRNALALALPLMLGTALPLGAFQDMQIEQVLGGICGSSAFQVVQLRMRSDGEHGVMGCSIRAWDASGANPFTLVTFKDPVSLGLAGRRILVMTGALAGVAGITPDALMLRIPDDYLRAGRITWEGPGAVIWFSLAWGGAAYTGSNSGSTQNDDDGDYGPPFPGPIPLGTAQGLVFQGPISAQNTSNAASFALTTSVVSPMLPATLTNNAGASVTLPPECLLGDRFLTGDTGTWSSTIP